MDSTNATTTTHHHTTNSNANSDSNGGKIETLNKFGPNVSQERAFSDFFGATKTNVSGTHAPRICIFTTTSSKTINFGNERFPTNISKK